MQALREYLTAASQKPLKYGSHDCCTVSAGWVQQVTGIDVMIGQGYDGLRDGLEKLERFGFRDHVALFEDKLPKRSALMLRAGDVAVLPGNRRAAIGIVQSGGESIWCFGPKGASVVPLTEALHGFEVRQ